MGPQVSVIMPAYNTAPYIRQAIESALGQTLADLEILVVDDASTDDTAAVVRAIDDPRVRLFTLDTNQGAAVARNRALAEARGEWVAVLDSDDWYDSHRLKDLLHVAQQSAATMVADDIWFIVDGQPAPWTTLIEESGQSVPATQVVTVLEYLASDRHGQRGLHLGLSKPLINRSFLIEHGIRYRPEVLLGQDFFFYLECLICGARYVLHPRPYYYYRSRPGSLYTSSQVDRLTQACRATRAWLAAPAVVANPALGAALGHNLRAYERSLAYYSVVEALKQKPLRLGTVLRALWQNPYFWVRVAQKLPHSLGRGAGKSRDQRRTA